jgi:uncharacterized protein (DUF58 family)
MQPGRRMGRLASIFYYGMIAVFVFLAALALIAGWWIYVLLSALFGLAFAVSAPYVLGRGWRPAEPKPSRRPVVRRRR